MIANIRLIVWGIAAAAVLGAGLYVRHLHKEAKRVPALIETINNAQKELDRTRAQNQQALEKENALQKQLASARNTAADLASRLRRAYADVPEVAPGPAEPDGTPGTGSGPDELDDAVTRVIAACKSDSIRLNGWQRYYEEVSPELK